MVWEVLDDLVQYPCSVEVPEFLYLDSPSLNQTPIVYQFKEMISARPSRLTRDSRVGVVTPIRSEDPSSSQS